MGGAAADAQSVDGLDDLVQPVEVANVDEQGRRGQAQLEQGQEAVAAGQDLRVALAIDEDLEGLMQGRRPDVVELSRDHPSSFASSHGRAHRLAKQRAVLPATQGRLPGGSEVGWLAAETGRCAKVVSARIGRGRSPVNEVSIWKPRGPRAGSGPRGRAGWRPARSWTGRQPGRLRARTRRTAPSGSDRRPAR